MPDFEKKRMGNYASITVGGTPSTAIPSYWGGEIPWMASGDVHKKRIKDVDGRITQKGLQCSNATMVSPPAVAVALAGQGKTRGTAALTEIEICTNQSVALIKTRESSLSSTYLFHLLTHEYEDLRAASAGGGRAGLSKTILENYEIGFPVIHEQKAIVTVLDTADEAIQSTLAMLDKQDKLKQALLESIITGSIKNLAPSSKDFVPITYYAQVNPTVDTSSLSPKAVVSFIPMADVSERCVWTNNQSATLGKVIKGFTVFKDKDTLVAKITPCLENGKGAFVDHLINGIGFGSTEFHVLRPISGKAEPRFVTLITQAKSFRLKAEGMMSGSAGQQRVPTDFFSRFILPAYSKDSQKSIVDLLASVDDAIAECNKELTKLQNIKSGLMQDLLTGKRRVQNNKLKEAA